MAQNDLDQANNNLAAAQAEITSKQAALDNLQSQYDDALNQVTLTEAERDAYQSDLQQAQADLDQANNNLAAAQAEITSKQAAIDSLQADYDDARAQIAFTEAERDSYQSDLQQAQADLDQANNDLQFAQAELSNLQGQLDAIPAKATNGWSESSGQSITIEFDQSISSNNGDDLFSLINNNSLSVYIDGEQLTSADISNIYFGSPSYDASGGMTDPSGYGDASAGTVPTAVTNPELFDASGTYIGETGADASGSFDASGAMADAGAFDASGAMASGPSCFTIEFNDGSLLKEGQTVFVTYDAAGGLQDSNGNSINPFSQLVINSSELYNDQTAPTISPDEFNKPSINADGQTISLNFSEEIDQASLQSALDNSSFQLFIDGEQRDDITLSLESNDDFDDGESSASYSPDLEQLEFDIEEGISVDGFNSLSLEQLKDAFTFTSEGNPVDVTITNIELVDEDNPNSFILTFDSADFENYINGPGLDAEFDNENLGLKDVADENLIGNHYLSVALADDMDASGMAYDASGNSSSSSFTLRINGSTVESGQNVLLSYVNTDTADTSSGITDLAGNELASFAFQLDNMSGQDYTNPELTDGYLDASGSNITVNVSEFIGFDLNQNDASGYVDPTGDASGMGFDASGADGSNFDWDSEAIKDAFTLNVNGQNLSSADFSLSYDSAMQSILVISIHRLKSLQVKPSPSTLTAQKLLLRVHLR